MKHNNQLIELIQEQISNSFDFLGNDEFNKTQKNIDLLENEEMQKMFIVDSLSNNRNKIKITNVDDARISGNWISDDIQTGTLINIYVCLTIDYKYDSNKDSLIFDLCFIGDSISIHNNIEEYNSWLDLIDSKNIDVKLVINGGDEISFIAFKKSPENIKKIFLREYIENFIGNKN
jgi:hypothetical protein